MYQQLPTQKTPKQRDFWIVFAITAALLLLIAISLRINADHTPSVEFTYSTGVNNNPWGYDFDDSGNLIYDNIPSDFCKYFKCISTFWSDTHNGYVVECNDGYYSRRGGYTNACGGHEGEKRVLYWHP